MSNLFCQVGNSCSHCTNRCHSGQRRQNITPIYLTLASVGDNNFTTRFDKFPTTTFHHSYLAIHVYDVFLILLGHLSIPSGLCDVIFHIFSFFIGNDVGLHHGTVDFHRIIVFGYDKDITFSQNNIGITPRRFQGGCKVYPDRERLFYPNSERVDISIAHLATQQNNSILHAFQLFGIRFTH